MKKLTITSTALAASLCFSTQSALAAGSLNDKDMLFAFGAESSVNTMMLSEREMVETEGEWVPWAVSGFIGGVTNAYFAGRNGGWNWGNAANIAYSFGTGVTGGLVGGLGLARNVSQWAAVGYGSAGGFISQW